MTCNIGCSTSNGIVPATCTSCSLANCTCDSGPLLYGTGYSICITYNTSGGSYSCDSTCNKVWVSDINTSYTYNSGNFFTFTPFDKNNIPTSVQIQFVPLNASNIGKPIQTGDTFNLQFFISDNSSSSSSQGYTMYQRNGSGCIFPQLGQAGGATTMTTARLMANIAAYNSTTLAQSPQVKTEYKMQIYNTDINADGGAAWYTGNQIHEGTQPFWWINNQTDCRAGGNIWELLSWSFYPATTSAPQSGYCGSVNGYTFPPCPSGQTCGYNNTCQSTTGGNNNTSNNGGTPPASAPAPSPSDSALSNWIDANSQVIIYSMAGIIGVMMFLK